VVRIYHNGRCSDALGGLLEDCQTSDYVPQWLKYQDCRSISIQINGIVLYYTTCSIII
jgi:hypothetical protein